MRFYKNKQALLCGLTGMIFRVATAATTVQAAVPSDAPPATLSVAELRASIQEIQAALDPLPKRIIRESGGTLGHKSRANQITDQPRWLEVDLGKIEKFDLIALIPVVLIDEDQNQSDIGFPTHYQITIFDDPNDPSGRLLFDSVNQAGANQPNRAPVLIECPGTSARRIRMTALELTLDPANNIPTFALAELLVFDGQKNRALGKPVTANMPVNTPPLYHPSYVTDGYMPFSQPRTREKTKNNFAMVWQNNLSVPASFTLDLGRELPIDEVRLYPVHVGYNFSVFHRTALGFPINFVIKVSNQQDFKKSQTIFKTGIADYPSPGHRLAMFSGEGQTGRYVRIASLKLPLEPRKKKPIMAFSEIEVISDGIPVSPGAKITTSSQSHNWWASSPLHLSDGLSSHGKIPLLRDWLVQLAERSQLELKLSASESELSRKTMLHSKRLRLLIWAVSIVIPLFAIVFLIQQLLRLQQITQLRESLAADLHDEIGGNFSGIALLCDQLTHDPNFPPSYFPKLEKIADTSRESAQNTRNLVQLLESHQTRGDLIEKMEATAAFMLTHIPYQFDIQGAKYMHKLPPKEQWHLLLFFKETLNNIVKHAEATEATLTLQIVQTRLTLSVSDNGCGIGSNRNGSQLPFHLRARAQKLHGEISIDSSPETGTTITLKKKL
jgi:signal transduction histidine kinase